LILSVPDEGYSRNVPDEGYSRNVPDEGYSRNMSCTLNLISTFLLNKRFYSYHFFPPLINETYLKFFDLWHELLNFIRWCTSFWESS